MPAGRPAGSSTKNKEFLLNRLQDMYGDDFHPIMNMAKNAVVLQGIADEYVQVVKDFRAGHHESEEAMIDGVTHRSDATINAINAWDKVAAYTEPKLKALEITGSMQIETYELSETERSARIAALLDQARGRRAGEADND